MTLFLLALAGCGQNERRVLLPPGVTVESQIPEGVSWASLLRDASDLTTLLNPPSPAERSILFSSSAVTGRVSLAHLAPEVLGDLDHGFFLRVEDRDGYVEATLAEAPGAGAITWIWSANPVGQAVLYLDGGERPVLDLPFAGLLAGAFLPLSDPYPFSALTAYGHNLHFPIVHTNGFRLAVRARERKDLGSLFYHVAWNAVDPAGPVQSFNPVAVQASAALLGSLAERFEPPADASRESSGEAGVVALAPGGRATIFTALVDGVIQRLAFDAGGKAALSDLTLEAIWEGRPEPSVSCPLTVLAGVSEEGEDARSLPCSVTGSRLELRWPMPYGSGSTLALVNTGTKELTVRTLITTRALPDGAPLPPLRFSVGAIRHPLVSLSARTILTWADIAGEGRLVGCHLRVDSRSPKWWGEGDEIVWLDGEDGPAWRGTGTEDYFGFAWCSDGMFDHPLRGQSRADGGGSARRVAAMRRYHLLDRLPFHSRALFQMEAWGLAEGYMDYETAVLWYSR